MTAPEKIARCKTHVLLSYPWWATLLLQLRQVETSRIPTMAVDGTHLFYNPEFTLGLSDSECEGVLLHETAHCALLHCYRRKWRDPLLWNIAADGAVNALLLADSITLPPGCVPPADLDKTAEQIYDELLNERKKNSGKGNSGKGRPQDVYAPGELSNEAGESEAAESGDQKTQMSESDWKNVLSSSRGLEPAGLSRAIAKNTAPVVNWREALAQFISRTHRADYHTWTRPSRRISVMPGWKREPESTIAVCIDTSGSINGGLLSAFAAECRAICAVSGVKAYVIGADAAVGDVIEPGEPFPTTLKGGGGTDFTPAIRKAEELNADAVVYLTDGDGSFPENSKVPVLWVLTQRKVVPFGESIYLEEKQ